MERKSMTLDPSRIPANVIPIRGPVQKSGRSIQNYGTPPEFISAVKARWKIKEFYYDLAADIENSKGRFHFCEEENSLLEDWTKYAGNFMWLNPPYANIAPWAKKCREVTPALIKNGGRIFFLTPASIGANWFVDHVWGTARVVALQGRLSFDGKNPYPKDLMVSVFGLEPGFETWDWAPTSRRKERL
jgi:phage N-6-adenine-methyltransferase